MHKITIIIILVIFIVIINIVKSFIIVHFVHLLSHRGAIAGARGEDGAQAEPECVAMAVAERTHQSATDYHYPADHRRRPHGAVQAAWG